MNFWDFETWGLLNVVAVLLFSLLLANGLKRSIGILKRSLIPTSVLAGIMILIVTTIYNAVTGELLFDAPFFSGNGMDVLEILTYHALGIGFIASALKTSDKKMTKKRAVEVFNTGVTTVATYLIQAVVGLGITMLAAMIIDDFFAASGVLLPFGFGQGTGQALNYGNIYQEQGFVGGADFGLTIAALGFLSASVGGVIHLSYLKKKGKICSMEEETEVYSADDVQTKDELPMNGGLDKTTVQIALIGITYLVTYLAMYALGLALPGMKATIYGFNFLIGVLMASLFKAILKFLREKNIVTKQYTNNFLLDRVGNFCFDIMVVAGIAAIDLNLIKQYWHILLILALFGLVITYAYNLFVAKVLFKEYAHEQFLAMYGMLTGTASTGIILLREIDGKFETPVQDNLVYQNFPAIVFGFPLMLLANMAPAQPLVTWFILLAFCIVMNVILFRSKIFKRSKK